MLLGIFMIFISRQLYLFQAITRINDAILKRGPVSLTQFRLFLMLMLSENLFLSSFIKEDAYEKG